jgi:hypothetical protein
MYQHPFFPPLAAHCKQANLAAFNWLWAGKKGVAGELFITRTSHDKRAASQTYSCTDPKFLDVGFVITAASKFRGTLRGHHHK